MHLTRTLMAVVAGLVLIAPSVARAQETDAEGSKDHPMFSRMPGYLISDYDAQDFGAHEFPLDPAKRAEGKYWRIGYQIKEGGKKAGPLQIARNYTELVVKRGGSKLLEDVDASGGTSIVSMPIGGRTLWLEVDVANGGENYDLVVVEEAGMEQQVEFTPADLANELNTAGTVAVRSILFDTGKATIQPSSSAILGAIADVLKSTPGLRLEIQGHTDNAGTPAANLKLSQERAAAVKAYLVGKLGIDAGRLTTAGLGDTKPIADNDTEEGRAKNRRVELVKQ